MEGNRFAAPEGYSPALPCRVSPVWKMKFTVWKYQGTGERERDGKRKKESENESAIAKERSLYVWSSFLLLTSSKLTKNPYRRIPTEESAIKPGLCPSSSSLVSVPRYQVWSLSFAIKSGLCPSKCRFDLKIKNLEEKFTSEKKWS